MFLHIIFFTSDILFPRGTPQDHYHKHDVVLDDRPSFGSFDHVMYPKFRREFGEKVLPARGRLPATRITTAYNHGDLLKEPANRASQPAAAHACAVYKTRWPRS